MKKIILLAVLILLLSSVYLFSAVPCKINYQGRLIKDNVPVDGTKTMKFSIYDSLQGGDELWTSGDVGITVHNGLFRYVLGEGFVGGSPVADLSNINWTAGEELYLEVKIETDILTPREPIYAYPYAINSHFLEGATKGYFINTSGETQKKDGGLNIMGNVGIGTTSPGQMLELYRDNADSVIRFHDPGDAWFSMGIDRDTLKFHINQGSGVGTSTGLIIDHSNNVGIGTASPTSKLDVSGAIKYSGPFTGTILYGVVNPIGTPTTDGFRVRYDGEFFGGTRDVLIIEKTDGNADTPDGGIAFVNTGQDGIEDTAMVIRGSGNVGIGTKSPGAKLEVAGNLRATGGIEPDWDSGWVKVDRINSWGLKTLTHNLNYFPRQIQWWFSNGNPGTFIGPLASNIYKDHCGNPLGIWITLTQIKFSIWHNRYVYRMFNASSQQWSNYNSGYYRILFWK